MPSLLSPSLESLHHTHIIWPLHFDVRAKRGGIDLHIMANEPEVWSP